MAQISTMKRTKERKYLTVPEIADLLRCSQHTIYKYVGDRNIPYIKQGHRLLFDSEEIGEWIGSCKVPMKQEN